MNFVIWSFKEKAWWRPDGMGYTKKRLEAGTFTFEEAMHFRLDPASGDSPRGDALLLVDE